MTEQGWSWDPTLYAGSAAYYAADRAGGPNVTWRHLRGEELPAGLPTPSVVTFAQSFHWMDRSRVAATVRRMLVAGGAVVHVGATTHAGVDTDAQLPHPRPPRAAVRALVREFLGDARRAGRSVLPGGETAGGEDDVFRAAGFRGPERLELDARTVRRTAAEIRASVYSLSGSTPRLFGARFDAFDARLRDLIARGSTDGVFSERLPGATASIWR